MRGRKPKPTRLKLIEGNPGKRPLNKHEPKPEPKVPTCPAHLCPAAKAEWKRLSRELFVLGIVTALDRAALAAYCQAYGRWAEAERKLKETPMLIKLPVRLHPAKPLAGDRQQAAGADGQVHGRGRALARQPNQSRGTAALPSLEV